MISYRFRPKNICVSLLNGFPILANHVGVQLMLHSVFRTNALAVIKLWGPPKVWLAYFKYGPCRPPYLYWSSLDKSAFSTTLCNKAWNIKHFATTRVDASQKGFQMFPRLISFSSASVSHHYINQFCLMAEYAELGHIEKTIKSTTNVLCCVGGGG